MPLGFRPMAVVGVTSHKWKINNYIRAWKQHKTIPKYGTLEIDRKIYKIIK
jgi:hypothetical protein